MDFFSKTLGNYQIANNSCTNYFAMFTKRKKYIGLTCKLSHLDLEGGILANSVVDDSTKISSVGQEIGVNETFGESDFINGQWETGGFGE